MSPRHGLVVDLGFRDRLREFLVVLMPFATLFIVAIAVHSYSNFQTERVMTETHEMLNVSLARSELNNDLATVISDLKFLSSHLENRGFDTSGQIKLNNVTALLSSFSHQKRLYDQIRFIDPDGQETIRINFRHGQAYSTPEEELQNKSGRYYFSKSIGLKQDEVYISPLDLNFEQGVLEEPHKPVIRFAVPIFSENSEKRGVLVLNYLAQRILKSFARASANIADHVHLLNKDGYWLHAPDKSDDWGFMLPHKRRFSSDFVTAWDEMQRKTAGQFMTEKGLFTFETVTPASVAAQSFKQMGLADISIPYTADRWFVVSHVVATPAFWLFLLKNSPIYMVMFIVLLVVAWLLAITRLKHRRAELESEYERRFRHVLESMELVAVIVDLDTRVRFCNDSFLNMTGWQRDDILGNDWIERFVSEERKEIVTSIFEDLKSGKDFPTEIEAPVLTRDGNSRLILWHNTKSLDSEGHVSGITAIGADITEKRLVEAQVRKLSRAVEQSPSIVMLTNQHGRIEYVNPMFTRVTGYSLDEVQDKNPRILKSGETSDKGYRELWKTLLSGGVWRGEFHNMRKNGELYWESASISALHDEEGNITNFIAVKEDITERKRLENELEQKHKELVRHQALSEMGRMAGMIAHDLRNPLSSVKMTLQILGRQASVEHQELQEIALGQVHYMENIMTDMLAYARPEPVKTEWLDITQLLIEITDGMQDRIKAENIELHVNIDSTLPLVTADPDKLRRLFSNLLSNAISALDASENQPRRLSVTASGNEHAGTPTIKVEICDNGIGLKGVDTDQLFEPFFTTHAKGTGLGLAIVRQIVEQYGGTVDLSSKESGETCAMVIIPASLNHEKEIVG